MGCVYIDTCSTILPGELNTYNFKNPGEFGDFGQIPGPSSSLFGVLLLLLRFPRILTGESYYSTS